ncbi:hypothetical protein BD780_001101 [Clostridium tetanomorphum]|nr:hypothetical protein [Clostridium tetanomorphum]NRS83876.1 hypothetical protein [Clostridium tetanomorphum]NRZ97098.1 hypothetical protein [Clostridium tetanomorphum]
MEYGKDIGDVLNNTEGINNMRNLGQNILHMNNVPDI